MKKEVIQSLTNNFESYANKTEDGVEFWLARDLQQLLGYDKWDNFLSVISKGKVACETTGHKITDHFADAGKMVKLGSGSEREVMDIMLISEEHITNNRSVRRTLIGRGITPENLPPEEDIKKVERKLSSDGSKRLKKLKS